MKGICGANCEKCELYKNKKCEGCNGCVFGKKCWIAKYIEVGEEKNFQLIKSGLIEEFNSLRIPGLPKINELYPLQGSFVNLEYTLPNGVKTKFLSDEDVYLGNQVECEFNDDTIKRCFGLVCNMNFLLVCEYGEECNNPELIIYKKR